ncbi:MAG: IS110 family transposase [Nitrososphaerales archaeon]|jgi:transposase
MYAAIDLHQKTVQLVLKDEQGQITSETKIAKDAKNILEFLDGSDATVVMESGYNHEYIYDLLKEEGYDVKVARPLMVKAIAYAKVKNDKVDARMLADLLRSGMIPECYIPSTETRELRDLARRRHYFVSTRTMFKNKIHAELSRRWIDCNKSDLSTEAGRKRLSSLRIAAVDDYLDSIQFLDEKIGELDSQIKEEALQDKYAKLLVTVPGISYYGALLISSEIADINRFPDPEHLCSYAKLVPGVHQSGDTQYQKADRRGNHMLNWIMIQCAHIHILNCESSVTRHYNKIKETRGPKIAIVAAARKLTRAIYIMLKEERDFRLDG